jgi:hypothetical protein
MAQLESLRIIRSRSVAGQAVTIIHVEGSIVASITTVSVRPVRAQDASQIRLFLPVKKNLARGVDFCCRSGIRLFT